jgi:hypothetical protein
MFPIIAETSNLGVNFGYTRYGREKKGKAIMLALPKL